LDTPSAERRLSTAATPLADSPHFCFMPYWANADAVKLAHGLRAALDKMNVKKVG